MTLADAKLIWRFVIRYLPHVDAIVAHCEQGVSRSPAVAAGLRLRLGLNASDIFESFEPNLYVLRLMLQAREPHA
jgi:predicted protein tyrosine phosphatase